MYGCVAQDAQDDQADLSGSSVVLRGVACCGWLNGSCTLLLQAGKNIIVNQLHLISFALLILLILEQPQRHKAKLTCRPSEKQRQ